MTVSVNYCVRSSTDFYTYKIPYYSLSVCVCVYKSFYICFLYICFNFAKFSAACKAFGVSLLQLWPHRFVLEESVFRFQAICLTCDLSILMSS